MSDFFHFIKKSSASISLLHNILLYEHITTYLFLLNILVHLFWNIILFGTSTGAEFWAIGILWSTSEDTVIHFYKINVNSLHSYHQQMRVLLAVHPHQNSVLKSSFYLYWWIVIVVLMWISLKAKKHVLIGLLPFWHSLL